jgi:1-acyl-sn-glycerol-3-phosphate acyltransferase
MKLFSKIILKFIGWKIDVSESFKIEKAVLIVAPHTSIKDFIIGRLAFWYLKLPVIFLIKKDFFWFPLGYILKFLGALPVKSTNTKMLINHSINLLNKEDKIMIVITPEGTRKLTNNWKRGFHHIAINSNVPVLLAYLDYEKKEGGIGKIFIPTDNFEKDIAEIQKFYYDKIACYPEKFNLSKMYREKS